MICFPDDDNQDRQILDFVSQCDTTMFLKDGCLLVSSHLYRVLLSDLLSIKQTGIIL